MEKRILGNGLEVSAVGLGCMGMPHTFVARVVGNMRRNIDKDGEKS